MFLLPCLYLHDIRVFQRSVRNYSEASLFGPISKGIGSIRRQSVSRTSRQTPSHLASCYQSGGDSFCMGVVPPGNSSFEDLARSYVLPEIFMIGEVRRVGKRVERGWIR